MKGSAPWVLSAGLIALLDMEERTDETLGTVLVSEDGEVLERKEWLDRVVAAGGNARDAIESLCQSVKNNEGVAASIREEEKRLATRRRVHEAQVTRDRNAVRMLMDTVGITKGEETPGKLFRVSFGAVSQSVEVKDPDLVPEEYLGAPIPRPVDRTKVLKALKAGFDVPGCTLVVGERSLTIK